MIKVKYQVRRASPVSAGTWHQAGAHIGWQGQGAVQPPVTTRVEYHFCQPFYFKSSENCENILSVH